MKDRIIVIGASWNGVAALTELVRHLPATLPAAVFIVQHVSPAGSVLPQILSKAGLLQASHAEHGESIHAGRIYVAPPDHHMLLSDGQIALSRGPKESFSRPAVDALFRSAAVAYGPAVVGVVLTGALDDGTAGLLAIKDCGGVSIVQDPSEATAPSMPLSAMRHVKVDHQTNIIGIAALIVRLANDPWPAEAEPISQLMRIENDIARFGISVERAEALEQLCTSVPVNCPECHSAVLQLPDDRFVRFRCRAGHAYSASALLGAQGEARARHLSTLFSALMEEADLAKHVGASRRAVALERHARLVASWAAEEVPIGEEVPV